MLEVGYGMLYIYEFVSGESIYVRSMGSYFSWCECINRKVGFFVMDEVLLYFWY